MGKLFFLLAVVVSVVCFFPLPESSAAKNDQTESPGYVKPDNATLKKNLTTLQYMVTQHRTTEFPFGNEYWDNRKDGIYVDIVSGEPLFSSRDKFDSGTGWPTFFKSLEPEHIVKTIDRSLFVSRVEVRSKHGDSHLGHLFEDGDSPTGEFYRINSAALKFIPVQEMKEQGYDRYLEKFL